MTQTDMKGAIQLRATRSTLVMLSVAIVVLASTVGFGVARGYGGGGTITGTDSDIAVGSGGEADLPAGVTNVVLSNDSNLDFSGGLSGDAIVINSGTAGEPVVLTNSDLSDVSVSIPDGTEIQGPAGWDGILHPPTAGTPSGGNAPAGFSVGGTVISVGSPDGTLVFDTPVTILLAGVTGTVGYRPSGSDTWQTITNVCGGTYAVPSAPVAPGECAINNGTDTKIVTFHFTSFGGLDPIPTPGPTTYGGGGSYTPAIPVAPATPPAPAAPGLVLGAAAYNFGNNLRYGNRNKDVSELHKILIAGGYLHISAPTGWFGPLTLAAVKKYQATHGVPSTGFVGILTRTELNKGK